MAITEKTYSGYGSQTTFAFPFPFLKNTDVKVTVDTIAVDENTTGQTDKDYKIENNNIIFNSAQTGIVHIFRDTELDPAFATYQAGSTIRADDLNKNQLQCLYALEEDQNQLIRTTDIVDGAITTVKIKDGAVTEPKLADNSVSTRTIINNSVTTAKLADNSVTNPKMADNAINTAELVDDAVTVSKIADAELKTLAGMQTGTASQLASSTALTASTTNLNHLTGMSLAGSVTNDTSKFPTSAAVVAYVGTEINNLTAFEVLANEDSFPATIYESGSIVSISNIGGLTINSSGVATNARTVGSSSDNVTISGFPSTLYGETIAEGVGCIVVSTGANQTYTYHKLLLNESDLIRLGDDINDFFARYRVGPTPPTTSLDQGDLFFNTTTNVMMIYKGSAWEEVKNTGNYFISTFSESFDNNRQDFTISNPPTYAEQILLSINGVIQKPNSGTSTPSEGFALSGSTVKLAAAPPSGSTYFAVVMGEAVNIGAPSDNTVSTIKLLNGAITTAKIADDAVTTDKLANSINSAITANTAKVTNATHTGDVTGSTSLTIASNAVTTAKIADDAVTNAKIGAGAVGTTELNTGAITTAKLADDAVTNAKIGAGAVGTTELDTGAVTSAKLAADSVTNAKIGAGAVGTTELDTGAVTSAKIANAAVVTSSIGNNAVSTAKLGNAAVTDAKVASNAAIALSKLATGTLPSGIKVNHNNLQTGIIEDENISSSAAIAGSKLQAASGSNAGSMSASDKTKLDNIETNADVTDATNVNAAGAVMNSDTSTAAMSFVVDEDNMSSNSATKVPTQQSVKAYVDNEVTDLIAAAPGSLDTLNELAAALNDDANFSTTVTNSIATKLPKAGGQMTGNITFSGSQTVDGRDLSADGSKLDGIEAGATADQTDEEIQDIVGAMLTGNTESGITVTYQDSDGTIDFAVASQTDQNFTNADHSKLDGIESGATADQTAAEIRTLVESASDSNVFTDNDHSKLNGIEENATADQTATEIKSLIASSPLGSTHIADGAIVNADINASAAIQGTKISPNFGSQNVQTSGYVQIQNTNPTLHFTDTDNDDDFSIMNRNGIFVVRDETDGIDRFTIDGSGNTGMGHVDIGAGLDVTGETDLAGLTTVTRTSSSNQDPILKVLHSNLSQGVGIGYNTVSAIGSNSNVDLRLSSKGTGEIYAIDTLNANGGIDVTGDITSTGNITINSAAPNLIFTESDANPDFAILLSAGQLKFQDTTNTANILTLDDDKIQAVKNLDALAGVDVTGVITGTSHLDLPSDAIIKLGDNDEFQIFHQSSNGNSIIKETGGGPLSIQTNGANITFYDITNSRYMAQFITGGSCTFRHGADIRLATNSTGATVTGNLAVTGTVDGRDVAADGTKLDGIEASADVTDATNVNAAGAVMNSDLDGKGELLVGDGSGDPSALAVGTDGYILKADSSTATGLVWSAAGSGGDANQNAFSNVAVSGQTTVAADSTTDTLNLAAGSNVTITTNATNDTITIASTDTNTTYSVGDGGLTQNNFTNALKSKLDGIESNATADQTASDIKTLLNSSGLVNAQIDASAAIAGTKIDPDFGSQAITTTANLSSGNITVTGSQARINLTDSDNNSDFQVANENGVFRIRDTTNQTNRLTVASNGTVDIAGNLDVNNGIDVVDGDITLASGHTVDGRDVSADGSKLDGIESGATADQTAAEIRTLVDSASDSNVLTDALKSKLDGIAASATNVTNNNQLTNGAGYVTSSGNTIIGTDSDIDTSGATVIDQLNMTDGVIQSHSTRTMTLADLGYTGATNANNITNNNQLSNGAGYITSADGGNASYLSGITADQFLRSNTADTASGLIALNGGWSSSAQPAMTVYNPNDRTLDDSDSGDPIHFASNHFTQGGISRTQTNSRFTVPSSGKYLCLVGLSGEVNTHSHGDGVRLEIMRNGSTYIRDTYPLQSMGSENGMEWSFTANVILSLSANDYLEVETSDYSGTVSSTLKRGSFSIIKLA